MKYYLNIFLYLNIYTLISCSLYAQDLSVELEVNPESETQVVDSVFLYKNYPNFLLLKKDVDSLTARLQKAGYINAFSTPLTKKNDSTYKTTINLGDKVTTLKIFYDEEIFSKEILRKVSRDIDNSYFIIPFNQVENTLSYLNQIITKKGDAFASVKLIDISLINNSSLQATILVSTSNLRTIDNIVIKEYEKFPRTFLKYYAGIKVGKIFNRETIIAKNEILNNLGFVNSIRTPEVLFKPDSTEVYFYLRKQNNNNFDGILGFTTDEETNNLRLSGYLNLALINNLNYGEQLLINYRADGDDQINFLANAQLPYLFKTPMGAELELQIFKRDSTFITTNQQIKISYQINPSTQSYVGYKSSESTNLKEEIEVGSTVLDYNATFITLGGIYTKRQSSVFFPVKSIVKLDGEIGERTATDTKTKQLQLNSRLSHIFNLNFQNSIYVNNSTSILSSENYLTNELFRFGGIRSIRGFNENSIDATFFTVLNTEYRYIVNDGLYFNSILDVAYYENNILGIQQNLYSLGLGLGLQTKAGILSLSFANGNAREQTFNIGNTKVHISLSARF